MKTCTCTCGHAVGDHHAKLLESRQRMNAAADALRDAHHVAIAESPILAHVLESLLGRAREISHEISLLVDLDDTGAEEE